MNNSGIYYRGARAVPYNSANWAAQTVADRPNARPGVKEKASTTARLMVLAIICCVFEGAGRKWLVPGASTPEQALF